MGIFHGCVSLREGTTFSGERALCRNQLAHWRECLGVPGGFKDPQKGLFLRASHDRCWTKLRPCQQPDHVVASHQHVCLFFDWWRWSSIFLSEMKETLKCRWIPLCFNHRDRFFWETHSKGEFALAAFRAACFYYHVKILAKWYWTSRIVSQQWR